MAVTLAQIESAYETLITFIPKGCRPKVAIIGGSGLAALEKAIEGERTEVGYEKIPGFPVSTVVGHAGKLLFGTIGIAKTPAVLMSGRTHLYEGNDLQVITFPIRVFSLLGVETLIVTNAVGGLNAEYNVGDVVVMNDHINFAGLTGMNPLRGPNLDSFGPRFLALSDAYDLDLRRTAHSAWKDIRTNIPSQMNMHEGVYAFVCGPNYETRAECRMLSTLGADTVGMSSVPETIIARHCGIRVLAMSLVTNNAVMYPGPRGDEVNGKSYHELQNVMKEGMANHEEVLETSRNAAEEIMRLIVRIVELDDGKR